ncbi:MAG TPA: prepilin-type N-terminal cleavage/methylation domain-containing protein [Candidatus Krumholzibacteria bacterium]|nr:prepilin-type N-terminal cleavage/methylation domain-containing protein [Candidatus Krumholzibacteria bacterium]
MEHQTGPRRIAHRKRWSNQSGFTVVELMAALLLFSIGLVALARVLPQGMEVRDRGRRMTVAMQLAREQIETLRSLPFTDPDLANGQHVDNEVLRNGSYRRRWTVQDDTPLPNMMRIEVRVAFTTSEADSEAVIVTQRTR